MKRKLTKLNTALCMMMAQTVVHAGTGQFFHVSATGTPAAINISLCLNAWGPLTCQTYDVSALSLSINTVVPNHLYPDAGIKINTPGYTPGIGCTPINNGYCIFAVSNTTPANITLQTTGQASIFLAGGYYSSTNTQSYPLLAKSNDGKTWSYPSSIITNLPTNPAITGGFFNGTTCNNGNICFAAGEDNTHSDPMIAWSNDGGNSWTYPVGNAGTNPPPSDYVTGGFNNATSTGSTYLAVGQYSNGTTSYPLIIQSNNGATWTYTLQSSGPLPAGFNNSGNLYQATCTGNSCIAAGTYYNGTANVPMIVTSTNGGQTWTYTLDSSHPSLPSDFNTNGNLYSASCSGTNCIAVGSYYNTSNVYYPLIATSNNSGQTWTYTLKSDGPLPAGFSNDGFLNQASCTGNSCIAAGRYSNGTASVPMIVTSTNNGQTWAYTLDYIHPSLPSNSGTFNTTSCSGSTCIAGGSYISGLIYYPLLATSTDSGLTWTYTITGSQPALPADFGSNAILSSANCHGNNCIVAGSYSDITNIKTYPLLANSTNGGQTWSYVISGSGPLPSDFSNYGKFKPTGTNPPLAPRKFSSSLLKGHGLKMQK